MSRGLEKAGKPRYLLNHRWRVSRQLDHWLAKISAAIERQSAAGQQSVGCQYSDRAPKMVDLQADRVLPPHRLEQEVRRRAEEQLAAERKQQDRYQAALAEWRSHRPQQLRAERRAHTRRRPAVRQVKPALRPQPAAEQQ